MSSTRAFAQIKRVSSRGSSNADMWILETSEKEASGYKPKKGITYSKTKKKVVIRMATGSINDYNVMVGSGLVRIDSLTTPGGSGKMTITFDRDEAAHEFPLYVYVLDQNGDYEPVYQLAAGDPKPSMTSQRVPMAAIYSPPPVVIGGGTPVVENASADSTPA